MMGTAADAPAYRFVAAHCADCEISSVCIRSDDHPASVAVIQNPPRRNGNERPYVLLYQHNWAHLLPLRKRMAGLDGSYILTLQVERLRHRGRSSLVERLGRDDGGLTWTRLPNKKLRLNLSASTPDTCDWRQPPNLICHGSLDCEPCSALHMELKAVLPPKGHLGYLTSRLNHA